MSGLSLLELLRPQPSTWPHPEVNLLASPTLSFPFNERLKSLLPQERLLSATAPVSLRLG